MSAPGCSRPPRRGRCRGPGRWRRPAGCESPVRSRPRAGTPPSAPTATGRPASRSGHPPVRGGEKSTVVVHYCTSCTRDEQRGGSSTRALLRPRRLFMIVMLLRCSGLVRRRTRRSTFSSRDGAMAGARQLHAASRSFTQLHAAAACSRPHTAGRSLPCRRLRPLVAAIGVIEQQHCSMPRLISSHTTRLATHSWPSRFLLTSKHTLATDSTWAGRGSGGSGRGTAHLPRFGGRRSSAPLSAPPARLRL